MRDIKIKEILELTLEEAYEAYNKYNTIFIIKDGKLSGLSLERGK